MKIILTIIAFISLLCLPVVFAEGISVDQLKQMMTRSADNLTTYTYTRSAESTIIYSNESLQDKFAAIKATEGKVNLTAQSGWWSHQLTDIGTGQVLTWQGYFLNGTELWKEGDNWTQFIITDPDALLADYNELPGQAALLNYSNLSIIGSEEMGGEDCYKLAAEPIPLIEKTILGTQIFASYLSSPFPLPDEVDNKNFDFDNTSILENSNVSITAWISKKTSLLKRIEIDSSLILTPSILKIEELNFTIQSDLHEQTDYSNFGESVQIVLPEESQNQSTRMKGADWRWAIFGLVEP
ncbi:MAG: hypothetical protein M0Q13_09240 [Methanothrix sp.]|jgi:hypothetical protein|nr:hypothetical protein [Methanothrix sp.]